MARQLYDENITGPATFGRRKVAPRACVADSKKHLRTFLTEVLEDLGFVTSECAKADDLAMVLETQLAGSHRAWSLGRRDRGRQNS